MGTETELLGRIFDAWEGILREISGIEQELKLVQNALIRQGILPEK